MAKILMAVIAVLLINIAGLAHAQDYCPLGGDPSQGFNLVYFDNWDNWYTGWASDGPYTCANCINTTAQVNNVGAQAGCMSIADEQNGQGWLCQGTSGFWDGSIEPNSSSNRSAFLLNLFNDPKYDPPSTGECIGNIGQYLVDPP